MVETLLATSHKKQVLRCAQHDKSEELRRNKLRLYGSNGRTET